MKLRPSPSTLLDIAALGWTAYVLLTFAWPACAFAIVPLVYVLRARRLRWLVGDRDRVIACHAAMIKRLDEALSKCSRGRSKLKLVKKVVPS
jgi:hypothetical protein